MIFNNVVHGFEPGETASYSTDNVFVVILFVYGTYIDGIFIAYRWYVNGIISSYHIINFTTNGRDFSNK